MQYQAILFHGLAFLVIILVNPATGVPPHLHGVEPTRYSLYKNNGGKFYCHDGNGLIKFDKVNDDYCDCKDSSDEPGTSACPAGRFYCENIGHRGRYVPSSRVGDTICDCCDGSDEPVGSCENSCRLLGMESLRKRQADYELQKQGVQVKLRYKKEGKIIHEKKLLRKEEIEVELDEQRGLLEAAATAKEEAEVVEKEAKEKFDKLKEEREKDELNKESDEVPVDTALEKSEKKKDTGKVDKDEVDEAFYELDDNSDGLITVDEVTSVADFDVNDDGETTAEEAESYMGGLTEVNRDDFRDYVWEYMKHVYKGVGEDDDVDIPEEQDDGEVVGEVKETEEEFDEETQLAVEAATTARNHHKEIESKVNQLDTELRELKKVVEGDHGGDYEFLPLRGQCFELSTAEYTYRLCPFDKVVQSGASGGSETSLGRWGSWEDDTMVYKDGLACWNGPSRSTRVQLVCGVDNQLREASEPSRCEYNMVFHTPAVCKDNLPPLELDKLTTEFHEEL